MLGFDPEFPIDPSDFTRIRARNAINHIALSLDTAGQTPTRWQLSTYPVWAHPNIELIWEGVDLEMCHPMVRQDRSQMHLGDMIIEPSDKVVTYAARDLEPYRGFRIMMRSLPYLMRRRDLKVVIVGGDGVSYGSPPRQGGTWREVLMAEVGQQIDPSRVVFTGRVPHDLFCSVLRRSDAHIYLTYPFVASWSLREALAMGCPIIGSDTEPVREFILNEHNGLLVPFLDPSAVADTVLNLMEQPLLANALRRNARTYAERHLAMKDYLVSYKTVIERLTGERS